ncbi:ankyrin repeat and MYND domain-containing protein 2-like [Lineus longissimus]|uniref:ankyrin repeat and MYND domain-containing protein 2-like n=1 Tax=Lineus longissimus TaxID=88925 RepID=UPI002B4F8659
MAPFPELTENEKKLLESINAGKLDAVKRLLGEPGVKIDCLDGSGMTPLQHAAYRGKFDICELLLAHGADVNSLFHDQGYTTLMFAAISGHQRVVKLLLDNGARTGLVNKVGRTASQMAAFVGQHHCVSLINNFFSREDVDYYTIPHGLEKEAKLPASLASPLHNMILMTNLNPVGITMYLQEHGVLLQDAKKVCKVLELICEKGMKTEGDTNDFISIKMHYMAHILRQCEKTFESKRSLDPWIKSLIKGRDSDGFPETQEMFIRDCIKKYPYPESCILQHMAKQIAPVKVGGSPTALNVLEASVNGPHMASEEDKLCTTCGKRKAEKKCSKCKMVNYCNQNCQKLHWGTHKKQCDYLAVQFEKLEVERKAMEEEDKRKREEKAEQERKRAEEHKKALEEAEAAGTLETFNEADDKNELCNPEKCIENPEAVGTSGDVGADMNLVHKPGADSASSMAMQAEVESGVSDLLKNLKTGLQ